MGEGRGISGSIGGSRDVTAADIRPRERQRQRQPTKQTAV